MALVPLRQVQRRGEALLFGNRVGYPEEVRQIMERVVPILPFDLARRIGRNQFLLPQLHHLFDHHRGNRVALVACPHQQRSG